MEYKGNQNGSALYQEADVSSKRIFGNHTLCAQFLRDYSGLPMLANVQPEDIEDVSERYHLFREVELQADTVKKVHLRDQADEEGQDIYIISLIDHKSVVDYDVTMQILRYMVCIWENIAKEQKMLEDAENQGNKYLTAGHKRKDFRYPPIYPIVYYEGAGEWTAARNLRDRVFLGELFAPYIPDFTYKLVRTRDYSNEELLSKEDAISLLMLLNKIQQAKDFQELSCLPSEKLNDILQRAPVDVVEIIVSTIINLCGKLNLTEAETRDLIKKVRDGDMGYLFENMEKMDIQLERRNTAEQRARAEAAEKRAEEAEQKAEEAEQKAEQKIHSICRMLISLYQQQNLDKESIKQQLISKLQLKESEADELLEMFWKE